MTVGILWVSESTLTAVVLLVAAYVLSAVIGLERQRKLKSAGLKTHTLVGLGSALFTLVSAYGFDSVTSALTIMDPSRIAAQIVSGIGFIGAGVIFVKQNAVTGLTTAASIWVTAAVGMACGAGMPIVATVGTVLYLVTATLMNRVGDWLRARPTEEFLVLVYSDGSGVLRSVLSRAAELGFEPVVTSSHVVDRERGPSRVQVRIRLRDSGRSTEPLVDAIARIPGLLSIRRVEPDND